MPGIVGIVGGAPAVVVGVGAGAAAVAVGVGSGVGAGAAVAAGAGAEFAGGLSLMTQARRGNAAIPRAMTIRFMRPPLDETD